MHKQYQAVLVGVGTDQIDVVFPDFPGCVTIAQSLLEAQIRAREVLTFHIQSMMDDGEPLPMPGDEKALMEMIRDYEKEGYNVIIALVDIRIPANNIRRVSA